MFLKHLSLQNFRNYTKSDFSFGRDATLIVGPNTSGKTNLIESIFFLSIGKSFRGEDEDVISFGQDVARIKTESLEVLLARKEGRFFKKYLVNGVSKNRVDFVGRQACVLFIPTDLEIVTASPSTRRSYLDFVLEQVDSEYRRATTTYARAIRGRNRLLENAKKQGQRNQDVFDYWDTLLIANGETITRTRATFIDFINRATKEVFDCYLIYEKSVISKERLLQYKDAELASGVTLVGPHRDDFHIDIFVEKDRKAVDIQAFGSRGQQRLAVLQLKIIELNFLAEKMGEKPLLLLDDIFSELDEEHISLVLTMIGKQQTIITTTHKEFVPNKILKTMDVVELGEQ